MRNRTPRLKSNDLQRNYSGASGLAFALLLTGLGGAVFALSATLQTKFAALPDWVHVTLDQVAGVTLATGVLSVFWEMGAKRALAAEVMSTANLGQEVADAGLTHVGDEYLSVEIWREKFQHARNLDVFVAYANTWREVHRGELVAFARRPDRTIRLILPDIEDDQTIASIALRSGKSSEEVVAKIAEATKKWQAILCEGENCTILVHRGPQAYAAYRFDDEVIVTLYRNNPDKTNIVPTFATAGGSFGRFLSDDLNNAIAAARTVWPSTTKS